MCIKWRVSDRSFHVYKMWQLFLLLQEMKWLNVFSCSVINSCLQHTSTHTNLSVISNVCRLQYVHMRAEMYIIIYCNRWYAGGKLFYGLKSFWGGTLCIWEWCKKLITDWKSRSHFLPNGPLPLKFCRGLSWLILLESVLNHYPWEYTFIYAAYFYCVHFYVHKRTVNNVELINGSA